MSVGALSVVERELRPLKWCERGVKPTRWWVASSAEVPGRTATVIWLRHKNRVAWKISEGGRDLVLGFVECAEQSGPSEAEIEAAATAMLAASVHYPIRGAVTFKGPVGTNVASDALANLASGGVTGGALIIVGEDYGEGSSIMQERSHAFATKSQIWLLDPRPNLPSITAAVRHGFELSEASNTPVMLQVRIRCCHVHGSFTARDNVPPPLTVRDALSNPQRRTDRIVSGGKNINPFEIESVLQQWERVKEVAIVGLPDEDWGEVATAFIVPKSDSRKPNYDEMKTFLKGKISYYKIPKVLKIRDSLPKTAVGKINREALKSNDSQ